MVEQVKKKKKKAKQFMKYSVAEYLQNKRRKFLKSKQNTISGYIK